MHRCCLLLTSCWLGTATLTEVDGIFQVGYESLLASIASERDALEEEFPRLRATGATPSDSWHVYGAAAPLDSLAQLADLQPSSASLPEAAEKQAPDLYGKLNEWATTDREKHLKNAVAEYTDFYKKLTDAADHSSKRTDVYRGALQMMLECLKKWNLLAKKVHSLAKAKGDEGAHAGELHTEMEEKQNAAKKKAEELDTLLQDLVARKGDLEKEIKEKEEEKKAEDEMKKAEKKAEEERKQAAAEAAAAAAKKAEEERKKAAEAAAAKAEEDRKAEEERKKAEAAAAAAAAKAKAEEEKKAEEAKRQELSDKQCAEFEGMDIYKKKDLNTFCHRYNRGQTECENAPPQGAYICRWINLAQTGGTEKMCKPDCKPAGAEAKEAKEEPEASGNPCKNVDRTSYNGGLKFPSIQDLTDKIPWCFEYPDNGGFERILSPRTCSHRNGRVCDESGSNTIAIERLELETPGNNPSERSSCRKMAFLIPGRVQSARMRQVCGRDGVITAYAAGGMVDYSMQILPANLNPPYVVVVEPISTTHFSGQCKSIAFRGKKAGTGGNARVDVIKSTKEQCGGVSKNGEDIWNLLTGWISMGSRTQTCNFIMMYYWPVRERLPLDLRCQDVEFKQYDYEAGKMNLAVAHRLNEFLQIQVQNKASLKWCNYMDDNLQITGITSFWQTSQFYTEASFRNTGATPGAAMTLFICRGAERRTGGARALLCPSDDATCKQHVDHPAVCGDSKTTRSFTPMGGGSSNSTNRSMTYKEALVNTNYPRGAQVGTTYSSGHQAFHHAPQQRLPGKYGTIAAGGGAPDWQTYQQNRISGGGRDWNNYQPALAGRGRGY